ncbi:MAG: glycosyltransferase family 39 protein [Bacteroidales bacterium]|jgi:4-amino-4-deoxy-L-arabinose transferase-like glycosyltransferase|nr:glycosyltransferase family 39 protein [Bacteroidales bacterium]MCI1785743.1 glycosyltransferase family 39 protein [Bacteroidales bacterium]
MTGQEKHLQTHLWLVLVIVFAISFFVNNNALLPDIMESRNIITAREMVYDGHWMIPTMNGDLRLEKPPLPTWVTAFAEILKPDSLGMQRAMAGIAAVLLAVSFFLIGKRLFKNGRTAFFATLILCTCYDVVLLGRTASWDIYTHAFMLTGILFLIRAFESEKCSWSDFIMAGLFTGLSIMSKGPVSLFALLLPFLPVYFWFYPPKMSGKWKGIVATALIAIIVGGWWYAYIYLFNPDAMASVAAKESGNWASHNVRPWYYYWDFFLESGIWALLLLTAIFVPLWSWRERESKEYKFPLIWMLLSVVILSIPGEKKTRYLFPVMISASYLMGYLIEAWDDRFRKRQSVKAERIIFRINSGLLAAVTFILPAIIAIFALKPGYISVASFTILTIIILSVSIILAFSAIRYKPENMVAGVTILFLSAEILAMPSLREVVNNPEIHSIELTRNMQSLKNIPFYYNKDSELRIEEVYAAHRNIHAIDCSSVDSLRKALPFAILTHGTVASELTPEIFEYADTTFIDRYDNNSRPKGNRLNRPIFVYNLTLLTCKKDTIDIISTHHK